jgi:hypothetical protein
LSISERLGPAKLGLKESPVDRRWFNQPRADLEEDPKKKDGKPQEGPHAQVFDTLKRIRERTRIRRDMDFFHACLYSDSDLYSFAGGRGAVYDYKQDTLTFNVVRRNVDTTTAKISKNRPSPMAITTGGNYAQQRRARKLTKFFEGQFDASDVWKTSPLICRDALIFGTGITHNYRVGKRIVHERIFPWELSIDPRDGMYGKPRCIYLRRWVDKSVLAERFPRFREEIFSAEKQDDWLEGWDPGWDDTSDMVLVVEAWHLRSGDEAKDGRHTIAITTCTLVDEEYERDYFPFTALQYQPGLMGYFGEGMARQLTGIQYEVNAIALSVQNAHYMTGTSYVMVEEGSGIETDTLDNGALSVIRYRQNPPMWVNPAPAHPDTFNYLMALRGQLSFEETGVSQLDAQSQKPQGLNSGTALRRYNDITTEKFLPFGRQYEDYHVELAWQQFDLAEEIHSEETNYRVRSTGKTWGTNVLDDLKYADVRLDREQFVLRVFPTSMLAQTPEGRLAQIQDLINIGFVTQEEGMALLEMPDIERLQSFKNSPRRIIEKLVQQMLDAEDPSNDNAYVYPEPGFPFQLCRDLGLMMWLDAKLDGCPEENLALVWQFITDSATEMDKMAKGIQSTTPPGQNPEVQAAQPAASPDLQVPTMSEDAALRAQQAAITGMEAA